MAGARGGGVGAGVEGGVAEGGEAAVGWGGKGEVGGGGERWVGGGGDGVEGGVGHRGFKTPLMNDGGYGVGSPRVSSGKVLGPVAMGRNK